MWIEALLTKDDVVSLIHQLTPVRLTLGKEGGHERWIHIDRPSSVSLVAAQGVRVLTRAKVEWSVSVVSVPITLHSLQLLLRPVIVPSSTSDRGALAFKLEIEEADLKNVPAILDRKITQLVNEELEKQTLVWDFTSTLSHSFALPAELVPLEALRLAVSWGEVRINEEAMAFAVSFGHEVVRPHEAAAETMAT